MRHIPNFITTLNLASGFTAIIFLLRGEPVTASWLIIAAMVFDFSDGFAARLLKAYSDLGKELDSLADMVSFGIAPGLMLYTVIGTETGQGSMDPVLMNILLYVLPVLFPVCAGLRLARFNLDKTQATSFKGLPTPAAALAVVTLVLSTRFSDSAAIHSFTVSPWLMFLFTLLISLLMVSNIRLLSFKFRTWGLKGNEGRYLLIAVCILLIVILRWSGLPLIIPSYIAVSLGFSD